MLSAFHHVDMVWSTNKSDTSASGLYQVVGGLLRRFVAVSGHCRELVGHASTSEKHERNAHIGNFLKVRVVGGVLRKTGNDALHMHVDKRVNSLCLQQAVFMAVGTDDGISRL